MIDLVISDLDGTLLDHDDYGWQPAAAALGRLREAGVPLVLNTSKTLAELRHWIERLGLDTPFVVENGAAVHAADGRLLHRWGTPRAELLARFHGLRAAHGWQTTGFADLDRRALQRLTGLPATAVPAAAERAWTEPLVWDDSDEALAAFRDQITAAGLCLLRGGRFWHLQGRHDKGTPLPWLRDHLGIAAESLALGDSQNDCAMLAAADRAVWVRAARRPPPPLAHPRVFTTSAAGPAGWAEAIDQLFEQGAFSDG